MPHPIDYTAMTGGAYWWPHIRYNDEAGGALDAPKYIAAGYMSMRHGGFMGAVIVRGGFDA